MEKWKERGGGGIRDWDQEFKMINVVVFGKYKKIVHVSTSIMNVALACIAKRAPENLISR
jgi:hypothetical protein